MGQAVFGAVFVGGVTSIPGITTSVIAAVDGFPRLAVSNAVGGIAAQTVFLVLADVAHRRANLEHDAASLPNLILGASLVALLSLAIAAAAGPELSVGAVHPASLLLVLGYLAAVRLAAEARDAPKWSPKHQPTPQRQLIRSRSRAQERTLAMLWASFAGQAAVVGGCGFLVARVGEALAVTSGVAESLVGGYLTALVTSLPELVTVVTAVRRGALELAVADILGGNSFDVLFIASADIAWRDGSIYHAMAGPQVLLLAVSILMTAVLLAGLLRREEHGIGNIGSESVLVLAIYVIGGLAIWSVV
jgi:cation:H+ antiporter